jgi:hypothetical protein
MLAAWPHQHQFGKAHGFHCTRGGADIAWTAGFNQHKTDPAEKRHTGFQQLHLK